MSAPKDYMIKHRYQKVEIVVTMEMIGIVEEISDETNLANFGINKMAPQYFHKVEDYLIFLTIPHDT